MRIEPESGCTNPTIMFINVVFPHPDGPTIATNSPSPTVRLTSAPTFCSEPLPANPFRLPFTLILVCITPPHRFQSLEQSPHAIQQQSNQSDDDHSGDYQIISIARVAGIDDEISKSRAQGDHFRGDLHHPPTPTPHP